MKLQVYFFLLGFSSLLYGCVISDDFIKTTELGQDYNSEYVKKGNVIIANYKDSINGSKSIDENGVHFVKYRWSYKNGFWHIRKTSFYNVDYQIINASSNMASTIVNRIDKSNNLKEVKYLNQNNKLHNIEVLGHAKWKRKNLTDSTYLISYFTADKKLRKGVLGCRHYQKIDTISSQISDSTLKFIQSTTFKIENCE
jgi:hypothetical protein